MYQAIKLTAANYVALITEYCHNPITVEDYKMQFEMMSEENITTYLSIQDFAGHQEGEEYLVYLHFNEYSEPFLNAPDMNDTTFTAVVTN